MYCKISFVMKGRHILSTQNTEKMMKFKLAKRFLYKKINVQKLHICRTRVHKIGHSKPYMTFSLAFKLYNWFSINLVELRRAET